ncbi:dihydrolipoamide acetyltransferase family protein [Conexibacter sp. CPCC 206217]|uniref:dihydrolipoamide acetyltransferase family protein n=1 Tax=Conexibacter sp. CPCC 206217 TaxID=3064574 RepID=UPI002716495E|nr:dihydrolipoamide acetyltransferase family protein [Conexibacter sp. CPCC 206217]MDO8212602.1 dihydrolipoamide acetyltransferase family protein [Conexibacter sp. CPCC 206217]
MAVELTLPKLGPEMESGLLTDWLVADGDEVDAGQPVATIETDKVTTDLEAPAAGAIALVAAAGEEHAVGAVLARIGGDAAAAAAPAAPAAAAASASEPAGAAASGSADRAASAAAASGSADRGVLAERRRGEPLATPVARRMARAHGIELSELVALAPGRAIRKRHVEAAMATRAANGNGAAPAAPPVAAAPATAAAATTAPTVPPQDAPLSPMRRRIALRMQASLQETAQITDVREHDVTDLVALRKAGVRWAGALGFRPSFTDLFVRASALALRAVPQLNASLTADDRLVTHTSVNIGIAVAIADGLMVPVVHDADRLSLAGLHARVDALVKRARAGELTLEELSGGTFTVTNIGSYGSHFATPILVQGQVGIVGTGAFIERPVVRNGELAVGTVMYSSLTIDHRVVDGETAGRFQTAFGELLSEPERLLDAAAGGGGSAR